MGIFNPGQVGALGRWVGGGDTYVAIMWLPCPDLLYWFGYLRMKAWGEPDGGPNLGSELCASFWNYVLRDSMESERRNMVRSQNGKAKHGRVQCNGSESWVSLSPRMCFSEQKLLAGRADAGGAEQGLDPTGGTDWADMGVLRSTQGEEIIKQS